MQLMVITFMEVRNMEVRNMDFRNRNMDFLNRNMEVQFMPVRNQVSCSIRYLCMSPTFQCRLNTNQGSWEGSNIVYNLHECHK